MLSAHLGAHDVHKWRKDGRDVYVRLWIATGFTAFSGLEYFCLHVILLTYVRFVVSYMLAWKNVDNWVSTSALRRS